MGLAQCRAEDLAQGRSIQFVKEEAESVSVCWLGKGVGVGG